MRHYPVYNDTLEIGWVEKCPTGDRGCWHAFTLDGVLIGRDASLGDAKRMLREYVYGGGHPWS